MPAPRPVPSRRPLHFLSNHSSCRRGRPPLAAPHRGAPRRSPGPGRAGRRRAPRGGGGSLYFPPPAPPTRGVCAVTSPRPGPFPALLGARRICRSRRPVRSAPKRNPGFVCLSRRCGVISAPRLVPADLVAASKPRQSVAVLFCSGRPWCGDPGAGGGRGSTQGRWPVQ